MNLNSSFLPRSIYSQDQNEMSDNPYTISFHFDPIPANLRNELKCCYVDCKSTSTYYLKNSKNKINGRFCNSCKEIHQRHGLDNDNIKYHQHEKRNEKRKIEKSTTRIAKMSSVQKRNV